MQQILSAILEHPILSGIILLTYIGLILSILLENRNPVKSLGYFMILLFVPVLGLIIYYFFGRDLRKKQIFKKKAFKDTEIAQAYLKEYYENSELSLSELENKIAGLSQVFKALYHQNQSLIHSNNKVQLLENGEEKFPELFKDLKAAKKHIHIEYYILEDDALGREFVDILIEKAKEGLEVRLIYDDRGSRKIGSLALELRKVGGEAYPFMPVHFRSLSQANYRNHRKIIIIDGLIGYIGGINIAERYWNRGKQDLFWRDTHLKFEGSAVKELQSHFFQSLSFVAKKQYSLDLKYFPKANIEDAHAIMGLIASGPASPFPYNMEALISAIYQAKSHIQIVNPYFIPSDQLMTALGAAASAGIKVEMIIPEKSDNFVVRHSGFSYLQPLLDRGVDVYLYQKGFIHSKTMSVDGEIAFIGTVNMDIRSFYINFEIAALIHDKALCKQMSLNFEQDKKDSRKINPIDWANRPLKDKFLDSTCRLLTPLL